MEVADASTASGANVQQYAYNGNACQHWNLEEVADTGVKLDTTKVYQFQNSNSSLMLEVANASTEAGANVQQYAENGNNCQKWTLKEFGDGYYYILSQLSDGKTYYLDVADGKGDDGTNIQIFTNNKSSTQLFKFIPNPDGTYYIVTRATRDKGGLGVSGASKDNGANVIQWTKNGSADQKWIVTAIGASPLRSLPPNRRQQHCPQRLPPAQHLPKRLLHRQKLPLPQRPPRQLPHPRKRLLPLHPPRQLPHPRKLPLPQHL